MGPAFVVLAAVYRLAVGELAAIAKPALHMVLPAIGVATPLHYPGGIAALQPEVGGRGHWRGADRSRQRSAAVIACNLISTTSRAIRGKRSKIWAGHPDDFDQDDDVSTAA